MSVCSVGSSSFCGPFESKRPSVTLAASAVALAGIAALSVAILAHCHVVTGLGSMSQWSLVGVGAGGVCIGAIVAGTTCQKRKVETFASFEELQTHVKGLVEEGKDPIEVLNRLAETIPQETLLSLIKGEFPDVEAPLEEAKKMLGEAECFLAARETPSPSWSARFRSVLDTLVNVLDSILAAFGIAEFFKPAESDLHGEFKFQKIMMLVSFFTMLTATLLPMLGVTTGASIVGGTLLSISVLSVIWPKIRPLPSRVPEGENWSSLVREGKLTGGGGRREAVLQIGQALQDRRHPLLLGPSGVGKTQTVQAFTQALERGEFPELKGKTVFYFNMSDLVSSREMFGGGNKILKRISETIGRHRDSCILVFDEIHTAYQVREDVIIGEQLKTFLDDKPGNFPYVIGLTTHKDYEKDIAGDEATGRRFEQIPIESTEEDATLVILYEHLIRNAPEILLEEGILADLVEKTRDGRQPLAAQSLLLRALQALDPSSQSAKVKEREQVATQLKKIRLEGASGQPSGNVAELEERLEQLDRAIEEEAKRLAKFQATKKHLIAAREAKFQVVRTLATKESPKIINQFLLIKYVLEQVLEEYLNKQAGELNIERTLTKELIFGLFEGRKESQ